MTYFGQISTNAKKSQVLALIWTLGVIILKKVCCWGHLRPTAVRFSQRIKFCENRSMNNHELWVFYQPQNLIQVDLFLTSIDLKPQKSTFLKFQITNQQFCLKILRHLNNQRLRAHTAINFFRVSKFQVYKNFPPTLQKLITWPD